MGLIKDLTRPARLPIALLLLLSAAVQAQNLRNAAFNIQYTDEGIVSLRRTNDVADTEYIANGGSLGPVVARYRTSPQADWRDISHLKLAGEPTGAKVQYSVGNLLKTLAAQSEVSASDAIPGLATVNDGAVAPIGGGRGARGGRGGARRPQPFSKAAPMAARTGSNTLSLRSKRSRKPPSTSRAPPRIRAAVRRRAALRLQLPPRRHVPGASFIRPPATNGFPFRPPRPTAMKRQSSTQSNSPRSTPRRCASNSRSLRILR